MSTVKMWGRGQLTIPAPLRKELHLSEETILNAIKVGEALILTPKKLMGEKVAKKATKEMKKTSMTLNDLLEELVEQRKRYNKERYGG